MDKIIIIGKFRDTGNIIVIDNGELTEMQMKLDIYKNELNAFMDIKLVTITSDDSLEISKELSDILQKYFD